MKIAHITSGCLSGSPIRIVDALNRHTPFTASLINTLSQDKRTFFDVGIDWGKQRDEAIELMRSADVIHAHDRKVIEELKEWIPPNAPVLLHHHGSPSREQYQGKVFPGEGHFYHTSIVQYPERYVPRARLLPNLIALRSLFLARSLRMRVPVFFILQRCRNLHGAPRKNGSGG